MASTLQPQQLSSSTVTDWDSREPDIDVQLQEDGERKWEGEKKKKNHLMTDNGNAPDWVN